LQIGAVLFVGLGRQPFVFRDQDQKNTSQFLRGQLLPESVAQKMVLDEAQNALNGSGDVAQ
jgi:hypothetical protein